MFKVKWIFYLSANFGVCSCQVEAYIPYVLNIDIYNSERGNKLNKTITTNISSSITFIWFSQTKEN